MVSTLKRANQRRQGCGSMPTISKWALKYPLGGAFAPVVRLRGRIRKISDD